MGVKCFSNHLIGRVNRADLLLNIPGECVVPQAVINEVMAGPEADPARNFIQTHLITIVNLVPSEEILTWDLGSGETAVLSFALANSGFTAIVDDAAARKCANSFSIPVKGTLAVVIIAKQKNLIPSAAELLRPLQIVGFHLDDSIIQKALADIVGETWGK